MTTPFELLKHRSAGDWQRYCEHSFVRELAEGTLPQTAFRHYLKQDYLFLIQFARAWGLAVYKSRDLCEIRQGLEALKAIVDVEMGLHVRYCADWGISETELAGLEESRATLAYTRYVLDAGMSGDLLDLHVALAPCIIGYGEIASWIERQPFTNTTGNPYQDWIEMYAGDEYQELVRSELEWLNRRLSQVDQTRFDRLSVVFRDATRLEADFWQMGLDLA
ncbi:thiaminase/transcriptional activator TenA [Pseudorhizobium tarimense]|uniref:Aminopyrimidine aminohydrolase n=1 Tax=Pseudorhizobium tarimense TaxID=1079109 RepID=A0ABV2H9S5_9HYPH|nr:thiaminase II [Pseudorhizobium tarimense]MCJ8520178.1 thiaminase II [Pseudorhizobium tarimense]